MWPTSIPRLKLEFPLHLGQESRHDQAKIVKLIRLKIPAQVHIHKMNIMLVCRP